MRRMLLKLSNRSVPHEHGRELVCHSQQTPRRKHPRITRSTPQLHTRLHIHQHRTRHTLHPTKTIMINLRRTTIHANTIPPNRLHPLRRPIQLQLLPSSSRTPINPNTIRSHKSSRQPPHRLLQLRQRSPTNITHSKLQSRTQNSEKTVIARVGALAGAAPPPRGRGFLRPGHTAGYPPGAPSRSPGRGGGRGRAVPPRGR